MPEGDTIHRAARTLDRALRGRTVVRFESSLPRLLRVDDQSPVAGRTIESVHARGKYLMVEFSGGLTLTTHLRMNGSWHIYRPGERWQKRRSDMSLVIATDDYVAVGFNLPVAEFGAVASRELRRLGPDLLAADFDEDDAATRMRACAGREIADVLLDQRVVAGIGNVWKSELLFLCSMHPRAHVETLTDPQIRRLMDKARRLLRLNVERQSGGRVTRSTLRRSEPLWVYGRAGKPCRRCGTAIASSRQGRDARITFWCPKCQRVE